ncbi:MAG TPA: DUF2007 domain-containing protein [Verrucomicrobiae bacterium]
MKTVANCSNLFEAQRLKTLLDSSGIPSFIPDETMASIAPHHFYSPSGVRLQVADEHESEAKKLISEDTPAV